MAGTSDGQTAGRHADVGTSMTRENVALDDVIAAAGENLVLHMTWVQARVPGMMASVDASPARAIRRSTGDSPPGATAADPGPPARFPAASDCGGHPAPF